MKLLRNIRFDAISLGFVFFFFAFAPVAQAQFYAGAGAGAGVYMGGGGYFGQNSCSTQVQLPPSLYRKNNRMKRDQRAITGIQREIDRLKSKLGKDKQRLQNDKTFTCEWFRHSADYDVCDAVIKWAENGDRGGNIACPSKGQHPWNNYCTNWNSGGRESQAIEAWKNLNASNGSDNVPDPQVTCGNQGLVQQRNWQYINQSNDVSSSDKYSRYLNGGGAVNGGTCNSVLGSFRKDFNNYNYENSKMVKLKQELAGAKAAYRRHRRQRNDAVDAYVQSLQDGSTSGQICYHCLFSNGGGQSESTFDKIRSIAMPLVGMGAMYAMVHYGVQENAKLGYPTNPWMLYGMAYPFVMNSIYGAQSSGGCSGAGPGGAFGYPAGYYSPYEGGMFGGPYGMMGPYGMPGMMGPGMGMGMGMGISGVGNPYYNRWRSM